MSLRKSYAAALRLLRSKRGKSQVEISETVAQSHVSQLEAAITSATVDVSCQLAKALNVHPSTLLTLALATQARCTAREILLESLSELEELGLADVELSDEPSRPITPAMSEARIRWKAVQELKAQGLTQAEARKQLGLPESTVRRLWSQSHQK